MHHIGLKFQLKVFEMGYGVLLAQSFPQKVPPIKTHNAVNVKSCSFFLGVKGRGSFLPYVTTRPFFSRT